MNNIFFSLKGELEINNYKNVTNLVKALKNKNLNIKVLKHIIEQLQEAKITELCGVRYGRHNQPFKYKRAGSRKRTLVTEIGKLHFKLKKVKHKKKKETITPFLECLGLNPKERYAKDIKFSCADLVTYLSYGDTKKKIKSLLGIGISKQTIHSFVQEISPVAQEENKKHVKKNKAKHVYGDSTKTHSVYDDKNDLNVVLGYDPETKQKTLLDVKANKSWKKIGNKLHRESIISRKAIIIADCEKEIKNALVRFNMLFQKCNIHAIKFVNTLMRKEGLSKEFRDEQLKELKAILYALKNSVIKHLKDRNMRRLRKRISKTKTRLHMFAIDLKSKCESVYKFVKRSMNELMTYALLALSGFAIPYTTNMIERLMGEIAKRVKHKWMHWSTNGLENLVNLLLIRYCDSKLYNKIWQNYAYPNANIKINVVITK